MVRRSLRQEGRYIVPLGREDCGFIPVLGGLFSLKIGLGNHLGQNKSTNVPKSLIACNK
jgi:hypothetical protein